MSQIPVCVLLDIEGTVAPISFVTEVMFPFVRQHLVGYLQTHWESEGLPALIQAIGVEASASAAESVRFSESTESAQAVATQWVSRLMDRDAKTTALKQLQGKIWQDGFSSGQLVSQLFAEVPEVLRNWHRQGIELRIYSSGSVAAQRLFFGHTQAGNLLELFSGFYDTGIGGKKDAESYRRIAVDMVREPGNILFCSDVVEELDAAAAAGMQTALSLRPGNPPQAASSHRTFTRLDEIE